MTASSSKTTTTTSTTTSTTACKATTLALARQVPLDPAHIVTGSVVALAAAHKTTVAGRNESGRKWKVRPQKRASSLFKTRINNGTKSWEERQATKLARKEALELQTELQEEKRQGCIQKRERREENEKRRAENELKSMEKSVQTLNTGRMGSTIKAMSKKQLRQIKKSRVNNKTGVVEYVSPYAKG